MSFRQGGTARLPELPVDPPAAIGVPRMAAGEDGLSIGRVRQCSCWREQYTVAHLELIVQQRPYQG